MMRKVTTISLIVTISAFLSSCEGGGRGIHELFNAQILDWIPGTSETSPVFEVASQLESAADKLSSQSFTMFKQLSVSNKSDTQSCDIDDTAVITIYSTNGKAQSEIDVKVDDSPIGSLTTYFSNEGPGCKTPSAEGIITIIIPAGTHAIEAASPNLIWSSHSFSVEKCECLSLPLS